MSEFYKLLAETLDVPEARISPDLKLEDVSWDSLAIVATIAIVDDCFGVVLDATALTKCKTVGDIEQLAKSQKGGQ